MNYIIYHLCNGQFNSVFHRLFFGSPLFTYIWPIIVLHNSLYLFIYYSSQLYIYDIHYWLKFPVFNFFLNSYMI